MSLSCFHPPGPDASGAYSPTHSETLTWRPFETQDELKLPPPEEKFWEVPCVSRRLAMQARSWVAIWRNRTFPGTTVDLPLNRLERLLFVQRFGERIGEYSKIVAEGWNESGRNGREFMALPSQEYAG